MIPLEPTTSTVRLPGLGVSVRSAGRGETILLLHGFPHTKEVWRAVEPALVAAGFRVVSPDLRGLGDTEITPDGFDGATLAADQVALLDALSVPAAHVVGFDLGAAPAFILAAAHPDRVRSLTLVEAVVPGLDGAEAFLAGGGPWWFGFHQAPDGLAEDVVDGHEDRYVRHFLRAGSIAGVPADLAARFVEAYTGRDRLRAAFEHYRAMPANAGWTRAWAGHGRLRMPVSALGAAAVRDVLARQLATVADDLETHRLPDVGHIVPVDAPDELARIVLGTAERSVLDKSNV